MDEVQIAAGAALYVNSCITCHGENLQGVEDRGPSLIGVGQAATYFQVASGRMPLADSGAQAPRKAPVFDPLEIQALGAYIQANGGGPRSRSPRTAPRRRCATTRRCQGRRAVPAELRVLPQLHRQGRRALAGQVRPRPRTGHRLRDLRRHALRSGEHAEVLRRPADPEEKMAIITYVQNAKASMDPGGYGLGGFGPVSEGFFAFIVGHGSDRRRHVVDGSAGMSGDTSATDRHPDAGGIATACRGRNWLDSARGWTASSWSSTASATSREPGGQERRAAVAKWFVLTGLFGVLTAVTFIWWPQRVPDAGLGHTVGVRAVQPAARAVPRADDPLPRDRRRRASRVGSCPRARGPAAPRRAVGRGRPAHAGRRAHRTSATSPA